jgi:S-adenosylhomocysteine hydrolase
MVDEKVATLKLQSEGIVIDELTEVQRKYLDSWKI